MGAPRASVGDVRIRTDKQGKPRAWIKVAEPNKWRPRAQVAWEAANGPIPVGLIVHHGNRDTLDDSTLNLSLISVARHMAEHRAEWQARATAGMIGAKRAGAKFGPPIICVSEKVHGSEHHRARLTDPDVLEIRRLYATGAHRQVDLATRFGVKQANISQIVRRLNWQHI